MRAKVETAKQRALPVIDHVLARWGLARMKNVETPKMYTQDDHVKDEKMIAKRRAEAYNTVNLLDKQSEVRLHADGKEPSDYASELLEALKNCSSPEEKVAVLVEHNALKYINSVDLWYVKDPTDQQQAIQGEATYAALYAGLKDMTDIASSRSRRDNQQTDFLFTNSDEHAGFATLRRRRTLGRFSYVLDDGSIRQFTIVKMMTMSTTSELAARFGGNGHVERDKRTLQLMIDKSLPPIRQIDTVYYLAAEELAA